jgi:hypothetical protein
MKPASIVTIVTLLLASLAAVAQEPRTCFATPAFVPTATSIFLGYRLRRPIQVDPPHPHP